jgi:hypothetical protein
MKLTVVLYIENVIELHRLFMLGQFLGSSFSVI